MKTYILITGISGMVAGGPIYHKNKMKYMQSLGWDVIVFPISTGKVYIKEFEPFSNDYYPFLCQKPCVFSNTQIRCYLEQMKSKIDLNSEEIVIESCTDRVAYWGELLAKEINAKNFVMFLDEHTDNITSREIDFFNFKHERREFACITSDVMQRLFEGYKVIDKDNAYVLKTPCDNVVEDCDNFVVIEKQYDFYIGSIGRLEKKFVLNMIDGICNFAKRIPDRTIFVCLIGDTDDLERKDIIINKLNSVNNIDFVITGYTYPMPRSLIKMMDVFIASSGSAILSNSEGVITISMDGFDGMPIGVLGCTTLNTLFRKNEPIESLEDYLERILIDKKFENKVIRSPWNDNTLYKILDTHMEFLNMSVKEKNYYNVEKMKMSSKDWIKKIIISSVGIEKYNRIINLKKELFKGR